MLIPKLLPCSKVGRVRPGASGVTVRLAKLGQFGTNRSVPGRTNSALTRDTIGAGLARTRASLPIMFAGLDSYPCPVKGMRNRENRRSFNGNWAKVPPVQQATPKLATGYQLASTLIVP